MLWFLETGVLKDKGQLDGGHIPGGVPAAPQPGPCMTATCSLDRHTDPWLNAGPHPSWSWPESTVALAVVCKISFLPLSGTIIPCYSWSVEWQAAFWGLQLKFHSSILILDFILPIKLCSLQAMRSLNSECRGLRVKLVLLSSPD